MASIFKPATKEELKRREVRRPLVLLEEMDDLIALIRMKMPESVLEPVAVEMCLLEEKIIRLRDNFLEIERRGRG